MHTYIISFSHKHCVTFEIYGLFDTLFSWKLNNNTYSKNSIHLPIAYIFNFKVKFKTISGLLLIFSKFGCHSIFENVCPYSLSHTVPSSVFVVYFLDILFSMRPYLISIFILNLCNREPAMAEEAQSRTQAFNERVTFNQHGSWTIIMNREISFWV